MNEQGPTTSRRRGRRLALAAGLVVAALVAVVGSSLPLSADRADLAAQARDAASAVTAASRGAFPPPSAVTHAYGPDPLQQLDLTLPRGSTTDPPVLVYFHSGGWQGGSRSDVPIYLATQLDRGFAIASVDYRLAPEHRHPTAIEDADRAIRWLRLNAAVLGFDGDRIVVAGTSAGGAIATSLLGSPGAHVDASLDRGLRATSPVVQAGVVALAPIDLADMASASAWGASIVATYLGCATSRCATAAMTTAASPVASVDDAPGPLYALFGDDDTLVRPGPNAALLRSAWTRAGGTVTISIAPGQGHNVEFASADTIGVDDFLSQLR